MDIQSWRLERVFRNERPNVVMHLAAQMDVRKSVEDPMFDAQVNVLGTLNVLQQAVKHGVRKVIFLLLGGAIYGEQETYPAPEISCAQAVVSLRLSKLCGEQYLSYFQRVSGLQAVSLRYANVYGPRQDPEEKQVSWPSSFRKMLNNEQAVINGNGRQTRDFVFVDDVVEANLAMMGQETQGTYNVGTGVETSINDLFRILVQHTGSTCQEIHGPAKKGEQARSVIDSTKLRQEVSWEPKADLVDGLKKTVEYFQTRASLTERLSLRPWGH